MLCCFAAVGMVVVFRTNHRAELGQLIQLNSKYSGGKQ